MTAVWNSGTNTVTLNSTVGPNGGPDHTTQNIIDGINDTNYAQLLLTRGRVRVYELREVRVVINSGCSWTEAYAAGTETNIWVYHEYSGDNSAVEFGSSTAVMEFGELIVDDDDAPVTARGHHYWFLTYNSAANFHWSRFASTGAAGVLRFYGGMFEVITTLEFDSGGTTAIAVGDTITGATSNAEALVTVVTVNSGSWGSGNAAGTLALAKVEGKFQDNETIGVGATNSADVVGTNICPEIYGPSTECEFIQANMPRFGGFRFFGTANRLLEHKFKTSQNQGLSFNDDNTSTTMRKIQAVRNRVVLTPTGSGDGAIRGLSLRDNEADLSVDTFTGTLSLIDSNSIATLSGTLDFDGATSSNYVVEQNSFNLQVVNTAGSGINGVRVRPYRKSNGNLYGSADSVTSTVGSKDGVASEFIVNRYQYDADHLTVVNRLDYGNFGVRCRDYGRKWIDREYVPAEDPITDILTMVDNPFTVDGGGGQYDDTTAAAYTGVAITEALTDTDQTLSFNENSPSADTITRSTGSFSTDGFEAGMYVNVAGSTSNDGTYLIGSVAATTITLDTSEDLTQESSVTGVKLRAYKIAITSGTANTINKIYSWLQSEQEDANELDIPELLSTSTGVGYSLAPFTIITGLATQNIDLEGGYVVKQDGSKRFVGVTVTGIVSGARISVRLVSDNSELGTAVSSGTSKTVICDYPGSDQTVSIRVRLAGYKPFRIETTLTGTGITVGANFPADGEYTP